MSSRLSFLLSFIIMAYWPDAFKYLIKETACFLTFYLFQIFIFGHQSVYHEIPVLRLQLNICVKNKDIKILYIQCRK